MADKKDPIKKALEDVAEAANSLACHGSGGYTVDTSALDAVFIRSLTKFIESLEDNSLDADFYDPFGEIRARLGSAF